MIYEPAEDSFLMAKEVSRIAKGKKVLDVGTGSGILALAARDAGAREVLAVDIDPSSVKFVKEKGIEVKKSDLFDNAKGKFDLIVFNPPYLPVDSREDSESALATTGGEKGDEIIVRFLEDVEKHLEKEGRILLLVSSLTPTKRIEKTLRESGLRQKVVAMQKIFMEELSVWEIRKD